MRRRAGRLLARLAGVLLIGVVILLVGTADQVEDRDGRIYQGRLIAQTETSARIETDDGVVEVPIRDSRDVREGLITILSRLARSPGLALIGFLLHIISLSCTYTRWGVLLKGADLKTPWHHVLRLSLIGQFAAAVLPGGNTVGDLIKAFYVARTHAHRKTRSVVTIFADRVIGMIVLSAIACTALLFAPAGSKLHEVRSVLFVAFGALFLVLVLLLSNRVRVLLRLDRFLGRLPFQGIFEELRLAAEIYGRARGVVALAFLLSITGHLLNLAAFYFYARALGAELTPLALGVAVPVSLMVAAIPLLPGGWGMGEFAFFFFFPVTGVAASVGVALSITQRTMHTLLALPGGLLLAKAKREEPLGAPATEIASTG